ncbi:MAG: addiction module protein [Verrucomicrobiales bacterium]|nr:addiction module protein [Verrucomicrobiales bacterium]
MKLADFPARALPARQKLRLAEELWCDAVNDAGLPVPAWHQELLSERLSGYKAGKLKTISTEELKRRLGVR